MSLALAARLMLKDFADVNKVTLGDVTKLIAAQRELERLCRLMEARGVHFADCDTETEARQRCNCEVEAMIEALAAIEAIRNPKKETK